MWGSLECPRLWVCMNECFEFVYNQFSKKFNVYFLERLNIVLTFAWRVYNQWHFLRRNQFESMQTSTNDESRLEHSWPLTNAFYRLACQSTSLWPNTVTNRVINSYFIYKVLSNETRKRQYNWQQIITNNQSSCQLCFSFHWLLHVHKSNSCRVPKSTKWNGVNSRSCWMTFSILYAVRMQRFTYGGWGIFLSIESGQSHEK